MNLKNTTYTASYFVGDVAGLFTGVLLSIGVSQAYGISKLISTGAKAKLYRAKVAKIDEKISRLFQERTDKSAKDQELLDNSINELKNRKHNIEVLNTALKKERTIALVALIPIFGAIIASSYSAYGASGSPFFFLQSVLPTQIISSRFLYPGNRFNPIGHKHALQRVLKAIPHEFVSIDVEGGKRKIEGLWMQGKDCKDSDRTMLIYHGNMGNLYGMWEQAMAYQEIGFNVLVTTLGGKQYAQSAPNPENDKIETSELSIYADIDGEFEFLKKKGRVLSNVNDKPVGKTQSNKNQAKSAICRADSRF